MLIAPHRPAVSQPVEAMFDPVLAGNSTITTRWGEWSRDLPNSYFYEYPGAGHAPSMAVDCARQMMIAFLQNPSRAPDDACQEAMEAVKFVTPPPPDVTLVPFENPEMGIQGLAPEGWEQVSNGVFRASIPRWM
jgi:hypothetical protein